MSELNETIQSADWKAEKHAPSIGAPEEAFAGRPVTVTASIGAALAHPNTPQHHIAWMSLYFLPDGAKLPIQLAHAEFTAHAESMTGEPGPALTQPRMAAEVQLSKGGTLMAMAYCNLHGLWQSSKAIRVAAAAPDADPASVRVAGPEFLDALCGEAASSPRLRKNANLHAGNDYPCHRLFNALQPGTYVRPHRHLESSKDETLLLVRGSMGACFFDGAGNVVRTEKLSPGMAVDVPHGVWHTFVCLEPDTVFFEAKAGPYVPMTPEEAAPFAPPENDPAAPDFLAALAKRF
jgi:cupin fold WbuC family metalloprotein